MKTTHRPTRAARPPRTAGGRAWAACSGHAKTLTRSLLLMLALLAGVPCQGVAQNKPFPQQLTYPGCIKPNHVPQATLNADVLAYYTYWKGKYLKQSGANAAHYYVAAGSTGGSASAVSQSEAHGYGMVITALMAGADPSAKTYYDGLYRMYDTHRSVNNRHLMQWQLFADGRSAPIGSATDGDMDIAYSLLLAHYQWGSAGSINYLDAAQKMITNGLEASCVYSSTLRLGLSDDPTSDLLSTRPSDWMFDHMRAFRAHTNRAIWDQLAANLYSVYNTIYANHSANTGLISDFVMYDPPRPAPPGQPQADEGSTTGDYYYNASRVPLRLVLDLAHYGTAAPKPFLSKMVAWAKTTTGNDPTRFQAGYKLTGAPLPGANYPSAVFISPMVAASVIDPANQQWLNSGWNYMKAAKEGYFEDSYNMLCVLFVSGNWWVPTPTTAPTNQAPSVALAAPATGATFTAPASITLRATATDADGTVAKVEFFQGSTKLGEDTSSPYTYSWTNVPAGSYSLTVRATDNQDATTSSAAMTVTVSGGNSCTAPAWSATAVYVSGNQVARNGSLYTAKWWTQGEDPATASCPDCVWRLVGPCGGARRQASAGAVVSVYPNPAAAHHRLTVDLGTIRPEAQLVLTDLQGIQLATYSYHQVRRAELPLPAASRGLLLLKIITGQEVVVKQVEVR